MSEPLWPDLADLVGRPIPVRDAAAAARLAHLHLRAGLPALARVELETLAGHGALDTPALADLAEARWRGGDVVEAGIAAQAHLDQGGDGALAQVVVVEALAAAGRHADAGRLARQVARRSDVDEAALAAIFAGHVRSGAWPTPAAAADLSAPATPRVATRKTADGDRPSEGPGATDAVAAAETALSAGDAAAAGVQLAVALREEPALAAMILSVAERGLVQAGVAGPAAAGLYLVRGDALRLLGRSNEASAAFHGARRALTAAAPREDSP